MPVVEQALCGGVWREGDARYELLRPGGPEIELVIVAAQYLLPRIVAAQAYDVEAAGEAMAVDEVRRASHRLLLLLRLYGVLGSGRILPPPARTLLPLPFELSSLAQRATEFRRTLRRTCGRFAWALARTGRHCDGELRAQVALSAPLLPALPSLLSLPTTPGLQALRA